MKRVRERRMRAKGGDPIRQTATFDFLKDRAGLGYALELFLAPRSFQGCGYLGDLVWQQNAGHGWHRNAGRLQLQRRSVVVRVGVVVDEPVSTIVSAVVTRWTVVLSPRWLKTDCALKDIGRIACGCILIIFG